jgi:type VI protein secretion system component Hcp
MPTKAFCGIEGVEGDSRVEGFENQIELISFNHSITQPFSVNPVL